ncbi:N-acetylglutaminylglutamine amidotransferase [Bythopirellula polymerisocia]|uniref:asparagine synthase (glutamine-hydrolyzing) n=1 Tax=Bythopirellula polymerisocia TaxID=2528003 RepID=A0A5C6D3M8_9BACT|nr:N-acetylglutaminylglutamine amidotransferase [Bythopirellula polymerisocia]TWU30257.1 Asparagine synthetase [glutamine-hydrolyzing] 3 [Bythopirellula polymerisocia]
MCGICGEIRFDEEKADVGAVARMADSMVRRGPDADGIVSHGRVAFGHRRLKIIDLSESSQQPMVDSELGLTIAFNGAIYNYPEIRKELEQKGYRFFSQGDTEVILKAFHAWGIDCVDRFNGMFAFAIHQRDTGRVVLARDRLGIKPLYYAETPGRLRFASSLPALLAAGEVDTTIDPIALNFYMSFHSVVPPPRTILSGIKKLPPATVAVVEANGSMKTRQYWDLEFGQRADQARYSFEDWCDETLEVMRRAVKRRMVADVPVGVLLSGGLDSSLVVGLLCENDGANLETFSIGFDSVGGEEGNEFKYSDLIVERFQTKHHKMFIDASRTLPALRECIGQMSEPMVSHDNVGFYLLSQEVAKSLKVVQSGQGADEIFAGYHWYPPMLETDDALATYQKYFFDLDFEKYREVVQEQYLSEDAARLFAAEHFNKPGAELPIDKALRLDTQVMLIDDPVKRVDNHTMSAGLEARVPFLDHEVVEFAATVPADLKVRDGGKYILKEAARRVIPAEVIDRPKGYFPVPALKYLRGQFLEMTRDALSAPAARQRGLFKQDYVDLLLADPEAHITPLRGSKLWQLGLLELWLQEHLPTG